MRTSDEHAHTKIVKNGIRQRVVPELTKLGVRHALHLLPTTTLFDRPVLEVYGDVDCEAIQKLFEVGHFYWVKVSQHGAAQTYVTAEHIKFFPEK